MTGTIPSRVAVITGGRGHKPTRRELRELHDVLEKNDIAIVRTGGASGVDTAIHEHVRDIWKRETWPAEKFGSWPACGPIRNGKMLAEGNVVLCVAFTGGDGTLNCISQATALQIPVHKIAFSRIESRKKRATKRTA